MSAQRLLSITVLFGVAVTLAAAQHRRGRSGVSVQKLLERGALDEAVQRAEASATTSSRPISPRRRSSR